MGRDAQGTTARVGGWGHIFGDEGSGYSIGCAALRHAACAAHGRGRATDLLDSILRHWSLNAPELLLARVYQSFDKTAIAALAPLVLALARDGDPLARRIEMRAARELVWLLPQLPVDSVSPLAHCLWRSVVACSCMKHICVNLWYARLRARGSPGQQLNQWWWRSQPQALRMLW